MKIWTLENGHFDKIAKTSVLAAKWNGPKSSILYKTGFLDWAQGFVWGCPKAYFWYFRQNVTRLVEDMKKKILSQVSIKGVLLPQIMSL